MTPKRVLVIGVAVQVAVAVLNVVMAAVDVYTGQWRTAQWPLLSLMFTAIVIYAMLVAEQWRLAATARFDEDLRAAKAHAKTAELLFDRWQRGDGQMVAEAHIHGLGDVKH